MTNSLKFSRWHTYTRSLVSGAGAQGEAHTHVQTACRRWVGHQLLACAEVYRFENGCPGPEAVDLFFTHKLRRGHPFWPFESIRGHPFLETWDLRGIRFRKMGIR